LENPFSSIGGMVRALYPQRWLPYRYLAPLAMGRWDALAAVRGMRLKSLLARLASGALVLLSEKDEAVPTYSLGLPTGDYPGPAVTEDSCRQLVIRGALHEHTWLHRQWAME
ncbi:hypothetical protein FOMPIDRAFT_1082587, partial [Fomitopsis schrenkii]